MFPLVVFKVPLSSLQLTEATWTTLTRPLDIVFFSVGAQSCTLHREDALTNFMQPTDERHPQALQAVGDLQLPSGFLKRVRVLPMFKGKKESKYTTLLFYGPVAELTFNPMQYSWTDGSSLMHYLAKKGKEMLRAKCPQGDLAASKWQGDCCFCHPPVEEMILHRFWHCPNA
jgi:hypothetical protein